MDNYKITALIGYTGFVGFNLNLKYNFTHKYNSKNINEIIGKKFDCIVCCGISALKWWANLHPNEDLQLIQQLLNILKQVETKKFVLISTIDVYDNVSNECNEDSVICSDNNHAYGKNRHYVETFVMETFVNCTCIRLPGLFGYGLKKNIIYDYLNDKLHELNVNSSFQWYNVSNLFLDMRKFLNEKVVNFVTEPITNEDLHYVFCKYKNNITYAPTNKGLVTYNIKSKYGYINTKKNVLGQIEKYIYNMTSNKLIISNLSWSNSISDLDMLQKLSVFGIKMLEIAPHKYFGKKLHKIGQLDIVKKYDIYSFQSLLYPCTFNIFSDEEKIIDYMYHVLRVSYKLGVKVLVFGSPKNRIKGNLSYNNALVQAINLFKRIGNMAETYGIVIAIEPNAKCYGCDFIVNSGEGRDFVLKVDSSSIKLHLDVGCMFLEGENILEEIKNNLDILEHIHFSAPALKNLLSNNEVNYNELYYKIKKIYNKTVSIEMLCQDELDIFRDLSYVLG